MFIKLPFNSEASWVKCSNKSTERAELKSSWNIWANKKIFGGFHLRDVKMQTTSQQQEGDSRLENKKNEQLDNKKKKANKTANEIIKLLMSVI